MNADPQPPWHKDRRVYVAGFVCLAVGILLGWLVSGHIWRLPPNWGDIPTWVLAVLAGIAGWLGFGQFRMLRDQLKEERALNAKRDKLMGRQLAEAERRALADQRAQAEGVIVSRSVGNGKQLYGIVENKSARPITSITCTVTSKASGDVVAQAVASGQFVVSTGSFAGGPQPRTQRIMLDEQRRPDYGALPPGKTCRFTFAHVDGNNDDLVAAEFTDDAGFRWRLDENQHLTAVTTGDDEEPGED